MTDLNKCILFTIAAPPMVAVAAIYVFALGHYLDFGHGLGSFATAGRFALWAFGLNDGFTG